MSSSPAIAMDSTFSGGTVLRTLRTLLDRKESALLLVQSTQAFAPETRIWVAKGFVVGVTASYLPEETLGRVMLDSGLLSSEGYAAGLDRLTDSPATERLGEVLVRWSLCSKERVERGLQKQAMFRLLRCVADENATVSRAADEVPKEVWEQKLCLERLCYEHANLLRDAELEGYLASARDLYPVADPERSGAYMRKNGADPEQVALVLSLRGARTCSEACSGDPNKERFLVGLLLCGALSLYERAQRESGELLGADEISGLRNTSALEGDDGSRSSVDEIQATPASDSQSDVTKNTVARVKLNRVTLSLRKVPDREPRDVRDARILGEIHFLNALTLARIGNWERALQSTASARANFGDAKGYALAEARYAWKADRSAEPALHEELRGCDSATWNAQAMFILGELDGEHGDWDSAYERVEASLRWSPKNIEAQQKLKTLEKRRSQRELPRMTAEDVRPVAVPAAAESAPVLPASERAPQESVKPSKRSSIRPAAVGAAHDEANKATLQARRTPDHTWLIWACVIAVESCLGFLRRPVSCLGFSGDPSLRSG